MKKKYSKELFKKWIEKEMSWKPDKELDKRLKAENEGSFFHTFWRGSTFSNIPAVNTVIRILLAIFILWLFLFTGVGDFLRGR